MSSPWGEVSRSLADQQQLWPGAVCVPRVQSHGDPCTQLCRPRCHWHFFPFLKLRLGNTNHTWAEQPETPLFVPEAAALSRLGLAGQGLALEPDWACQEKLGSHRAMLQPQGHQLGASALYSALSWWPQESLCPGEETGRSAGLGPALYTQSFLLNSGGHF